MKILSFKSIMKITLFVLVVILSISCNQQRSESVEKTKSHNVDNQSPYIQILGIAQDAGYPQLGCMKSCCKDLWNDTDARKMVSCIGLLDPSENEYWVFDATPDIKDQVAKCNESLGNNNLEMPKGLFITHAHIGHYTGLMQFGREAFGSNELPVYAMPRMSEFLTSNGPWSQLVTLKNVKLNPIANNEKIGIGQELSVVPISVPHRDEFSETVGFKIFGPDKTVLFIPDIDKWEKWDRDIIAEIRDVDVALLDGSFFRNGEIFGRDMSLIPHPFIEESIKLFSKLSSEEKSKIHFIHFNHTNPVLRKNSDAHKEVIDKGFRIAEEGQKIFI